jgi:hypothetical protein
MWTGVYELKILNKRQCQQKPPELESGMYADHHGTIFFGFPVQK